MNQYSTQEGTITWLVLGVWGCQSIVLATFNRTVSAIPPSPHAIGNGESSDNRYEQIGHYGHTIHDKDRFLVQVKIVGKHIYIRCYPHEHYLKIKPSLDKSVWTLKVEREET